MRLLSAVAFALVAVGFVGPASAEPRPYRGPHPIDLEGQWHEEDSVHVHGDLPVGTAPFGSVDGVLVFLADPRAYGWDGPVWTYAGVHPLPARVGEYCGLDSEHRHPFAPEGTFRQEEGVWHYAGALRGGIPQHRPGRLQPRGGTVERPPEPAPAWGYPYGPVCGVVTERVGNTTTTFVSGYPGCLRQVAPVHRHHTRRPRDGHLASRRDRPARVEEARSRRDRSDDRRREGATMRTERRERETSDRRRGTVPPEARRGR